MPFPPLKGLRAVGGGYGAFNTGFVDGGGDMRQHTRVGSVQSKDDDVFKFLNQSKGSPARDSPSRGGYRDVSSGSDKDLTRQGSHATVALASSVSAANLEKLDYPGYKAFRSLEGEVKEGCAAAGKQPPTLFGDGPVQRSVITIGQAPLPSANGGARAGFGSTQ